jgi:hypothetical protein
MPTQAASTLGWGPLRGSGYSSGRRPKPLQLGRWTESRNDKNLGDGRLVAIKDQTTGTSRSGHPLSCVEPAGHHCHGTNSQPSARRVVLGGRNDREHSLLRRWGPPRVPVQQDVCHAGERHLSFQFLIHRDDAQGRLRSSPPQDFTETGRVAERQGAEVKSEPLSSACSGELTRFLGRCGGEVAREFARYSKAVIAEDDINLFLHSHDPPSRAAGRWALREV